MAFDADELQRAEGEYLADRTGERLARLYTLLLKAAPTVLHAYARSISYRVPPEKVGELCQDAATRFVERYLKDPEASSVPVRKRLYNEVRFQLCNPTRRRYEQRVGRLSSTEPSKQKYRHNHENRQKYIHDIKNDLSIDGKRVIMTLYTARSYRAAILAVSGFVGKAWIYQNAEKLATIYKMTHKRKVDGK